MNRPTRASEAGRAYLDLQNRARAERRGTQELLTLYVVERWLARLSASPHADKFVMVLALPQAGPIDRDPQRVLVLSGVASIEVILRADRDDALGPVLPLESLDALEGFFISLGQADAMYGWKFIDRGDVGEDWDVPASLSAMSSQPQAAGHTLHWFTECGRPGPEKDWERFYLQGVIRFGILRVERADARPVSLEEFVADSRRWWDAFERRDSRLSSDAQLQAQAGAASWRAWGGTSVMGKL